MARAQRLGWSGRIWRIFQVRQQVPVISGVDQKGEALLMQITHASRAIAPLFGAANAGKSKAARMAMMAMTTRSSISVNAFECRLQKIVIL